MSENIKLFTLHGKGNLTTWDNNANSCNMYKNSVEFSKKIYDVDKKFFENLLNEFNEKKTKKFTIVWEKHCKELCNDVKNLFEKNENPESVAKVVNKVRGNVAEILFEAAIRSSTCSFLSDEDVLGSTYRPIENKKQEDKTDGHAVSASCDNVPVGVQIKNWGRTLVNSEVLFAAMAMSAFDLYNKVTREAFEEYKKHPRQIVISFTKLDSKGKMLLDKEGNASIVKFIGPNEIDKRMKSPVGVLKLIVENL